MAVTLPYSTPNIQYGDSTYTYQWSACPVRTNNNQMTSSGYSTINSIAPMVAGYSTVNITIYNRMGINRTGTNPGDYTFQSTPTIRLYNPTLGTYIPVYSAMAALNVVTGTSTQIVHSSTVNVSVPSSWFVGAALTWRFDTSNVCYVSAYGNYANHIKSETAFDIAPLSPSVTTTPATDITVTTATLGGNVTDLAGGGNVDRYIEYGLTTSYGSMTTNLGNVGLGAYAWITPTLAPGTLYNYRAKVINSAGTGYGANQTFTTLTGLAAVTTQAATSIDNTIATANGNITSLNGGTISQYGHCWSKITTPTIADSKTTLGTTATTGAYTSSMTGLSPNSRYFVRAYVTTQYGTTYGGEIAFITASGSISVTTSSATVVDEVSGSAVGNLNSFAGTGVTATQHGHIWTSDKYVTWTNLTNVTVTTNNGIKKTGGVQTTWDAGATSVETLNGNGWVESTVTELSTYRMIGLSNGNTDATYGDIDFALYLDGGNTICIFEKGGSITNSGVPYAIGDKVRIALEGTTVRYYHNEKIIYTSLQTPVLPLIVDTAIYMTNSEISDVKLCTEIGRTALGAKATTGSFNSSITGLQDGQMYYVRAYATNVFGTFLGAMQFFQTKIKILEHGLCWATTQNPTTANSKSTSGARTGTGTLTTGMTGLTNNTVYYVRSYATTRFGTSYGAQSSFTTLSGLTTINAESSAQTGCTTGTASATAANLNGADITQHGHCWATTASPTTANAKTTLGARAATGVFTSTLTGLTNATLYYVRPYTTTIYGTTYGAQTTFTTLTGVIGVAATSAAEIDAVSGTATASITSFDGQTASSHGFCWSTSQNPTTANAKVDLGAKATTGSFTSTLTGMIQETAYYVRPYASNVFGTWYGNQIFIATRAGSTDHGFCYGTSPNPTIAGTKVSLGARNTTGAFTSSITGLSPNTLYYVRPYATTPAGGTTYGTQTSFTTESIPIVISNAIEAVNRNSIQMSAAIVLLGNAAGITAHGFCLSTTNPTPTLSDTVHNLGTRTITGFFSKALLNQAVGTYYIRAYATNSNGTGYSDVTQIVLNGKVASIKRDGNLEVSRVQERKPAIATSLVNNFPFDGVAKGNVDKNIIDYSTWVVGSTGSQTGFTTNGEAACNSIINDIDPFNKKVPIWQALGNDVVSDDDGGWNTSAFTVDSTKTYRFSVWVKRKVLGDGNFYLGLRGYGTVNGVKSMVDGTTVSTNPYFSAIAWGSLPIDQWVLVVGHVYPHATGTTGMHANSGFYSEDGTKIAATGSDYKWLPETTTAIHRTYLYYSTIPTTHQMWAHPRVDLCDGSEPTIVDLIKGVNGNGGGVNPVLNSNTTLTYDGLAIEDETTNILSSSQIFAGWTAYSGAVATVTQNILFPECRTNKATRIQTTGGTSALKYYTGVVAPSVLDQAYSASVKIKNIGKTNVLFRTQIGNIVTVAPGEFKWAVCSGLGNGTSNLQFRFQTAAVEDSMDIIVFEPQVELKLFPTSFTSTTRAAGLFSYPSYNWANSFTVMMDCKVNSTTGYRMMSGAWGTWYFSWFNSTTDKLVVSWMDGSQQWLISPVLDLDCRDWNTVGFSYDSIAKIVEIYANGEVVASATANFSYTVQPYTAIGSIQHNDNSYKLNGTIKNYSVYDRVLSDTEIKALCGSKFNIDSYGNLKNYGIIELPRIPNDAYYFPLDINPKDSGGIITATANTNIIYENGSAWVGTPTTNEYAYPTFNTAAAGGGWSHWAQAGAIGTYGQNTNRTYIYGNQNYSHWVDNDPSATGSYLVYDAPATEATWRSLSVICCMSDSSEVTQAKCFPAWNAGTAGVPSGSWTSITRIGTTHFYLCKVEGLYQDGSNDLVGVYVRPGYKVYFSNMQLEKKQFATPFISSPTAIGKLTFNFNSSIGLDWSGNWSIIYWKKPVGGYDNTMAGYNIDSLGVSGNTTGAGYNWWGKDNGNNNIAGSTPLAFTPNDYFNKWHMISLVKNGPTLTITEYNVGSQTHVRTIDLTGILANHYVTQYGHDFELGGWSNATYASNAYYRDLIVVKRALTGEEISNIKNAKIRMRKANTYVSGYLVEK